MANRVFYTTSSNGQFAKIGLEAAESYHLTNVIPTKGLTRVHNIATISVTELLLKEELEEPDWDRFSTASTIAPATNGSNKLKSHISTHVAARDSRKLPTYAAQTYPTVNAYPPYKSDPTYVAQTYGSGKTYPRQKGYPSHKVTRLSHRRSGADIVASKLGNMKDRVVWRLARITKYGVEEGMRTSYPTYLRVEC